MGRTTRRFLPDELGGEAGPGGGRPSSAELAEALAAARELEALASAGEVRPSAEFVERVMAVLAEEPLPAPAVAAGMAARAGRLGVALGALVDLWRVAWSGGRPLAVRAQALAFVLVVLLAAGSLGGLAAAGAWSVLSPARPPELSPAVSPVLAPSPSPSALPPATQPTEPSPSPEPSSSAEPSSTPALSPAPSPRQSPTPGPTRTPRPTTTTTPSPSPTPSPSKTPEPSETPQPTSSDDHGGSSTAPPTAES